MTDGETEGEASAVPIYGRSVPREEIDRLVPAGLRFFDRFADLLELSHDDRRKLMGLAPDAQWPAPGLATEELFYRLSYLIGIWSDLSGLLGKEDAIRWLKTANDDDMRGRSAITYLIDEGLRGFDYLRREMAYQAHNGW